MQYCERTGRDGLATALEEELVYIETFAETHRRYAEHVGILLPRDV